MDNLSETNQQLLKDILDVYQEYKKTNGTDSFSKFYYSFNCVKHCKVHCSEMCCDDKNCDTNCEYLYFGCGFEECCPGSEEMFKILHEMTKI